MNERISVDRNFYRLMASHELRQARRYAMTDAQRSARALRRCRLWRQKITRVSAIPPKAAGTVVTHRDRLTTTA
ncbi:hypothetical protein ACS8YF_18380 [Salinisphaera sp. SWV1]|uniref:hypothetical protein n=1 Tax=Salinisphaera sp. SWV1 TaxID=3454139 RepID=UPI003F84B6DF